MNEEGSTQTVTVTASLDMAEYYCRVHPTSIVRGVE
jgi:hypothetical protein